MNSDMKRAIIIGATSGIGREVAKQLLLQGWRLGIAGRRLPALEALQSSAPDLIEIAVLDVTQPDATPKLNNLIRRVGGMDLFLLSSGIGYQNMELNPDIELDTARTNVEGFMRMADTAFHHFREHGGGQLAVISSIAGTKGLGVAPAYSATKRFQNTYIDALEQLAGMQKLNIRFTDIRPGFVSTDLLNDGKHYPLLMRPEKVAKRIVRAPPTGSGDRLALCHYRLFLANDSAPDMETITHTDRAETDRKKIARSDNRSFSKTRYICPGTLRNKNNEERY